MFTVDNNCIVTSIKIIKFSGYKYCKKTTQKDKKNIIEQYQKLDNFYIKIYAVTCFIILFIIYN